MYSEWQIARHIAISEKEANQICDVQRVFSETHCIFEEGTMAEVWHCTPQDECRE